MIAKRIERRLVAATNSVAEAQATASRQLAPLKIEQLDRRAQFRWRSTMVDLGPLTISVEEYGAAFSATSEQGPPDRIGMAFPLTNVLGEAKLGNVTQRMARGRTTYVYSTPGRASFRFDTQFRALFLMFGRRELTAALSGLLGATLNAPLQFEPHLSLERGVGRAIEHAAAFVTAESALDDGLFRAPLAAQRFAEALVVRLLDGQRHNYSDRLAKIERAADPRSVRVAAEYLEANLTRAVRIAELADAVGVSARALQIGFQKHRGCTPAEFLRERRLERSRAPARRPRRASTRSRDLRHDRFRALHRLDCSLRASSVGGSSSRTPGRPRPSR